MQEGGIGNWIYDITQSELTPEQVLEQAKEENKKKLQQCKTSTGAPDPFQGPDKNKMPDDPDIKWKIVVAKILEIVTKFVH